MSNFRIVFENYWFLLLLIPAVILTLLPHLRIAKKYRRNRNRIVPVVLLMIVMFLSVAVLSGISFAYENPNDISEVILLVDVSHSGKETKQQKNDFIKSVLGDEELAYKVGIVTFARTAEYVAELSYNADDVYSKYIRAPLQDDSATNIAEGLRVAASKFSDPRYGRIVLISDGMETDESALKAIISIASKGTRVDTVLFQDDPVEDIQINEIVLPENNVLVDISTQIGITIQSTSAGIATIDFYDNSTEPSVTKQVSLRGEGIEETFHIDHTFKTDGAHEIHFTVRRADEDEEKDVITQNNVFYSYIFLGVYEKILIIERDGESEKLEGILKNEFEKVDVISISETYGYTLGDLREYDEIILMNIANKDMPTGFDLLLNSFVSDYGGGLLTVGGDRYEYDALGNPVYDDYGDPKKVPNAYNRADMEGSIFQKMLPVNCVDYKPPLAVMFVIDCSESMKAGTPKSRFELAQDGAIESLKALDTRDYVGLVTFSENAKLDLRLTSMTQQRTIETAIRNMQIGTSTKYVDALRRAGEALVSATDVENKHIIFITDGLPQDTTAHESVVEDLHNNSGITISVILVDLDAGTGAKEVADKMASLGGTGEALSTQNINQLPTMIYSALDRPELMEYHPAPFTPQVALVSAEEMRGIAIGAEMPELGGFYGTRMKNGAVEILSDKYVPIYAKWRHGEGRVGSFMSNLSGDWAQDFLDVEKVGVQFIYNVIRSLSPVADISESKIKTEIDPDNYTASISVIPSAKLGDGDAAYMKIKKMETTATGSAALPEDAEAIKLDSSLRHVFEYTQPGAYEITVEIVNAEGTVLSSSTTSTSFSYSAEYNAFVDRHIGESLLIGIARSGKGEVLSEPSDVFKNIEQNKDEEFDPRLIFIAVAIVLFLLNVAARKFKWKWPHEVIRENKAKKSVANGRN